MSELTTLREAVDALAGRAPAPDFGELRQRVTRRRRRRVALAVATAVAVVVGVSSTLMTGALRGIDDPSPVGRPTTPSPTRAQDSSGPAATTLTGLSDQLDALVTQVPGWSVDDTIQPGYDYAFNGPCAGSWMQDSRSGGDGGIGPAGLGGAGFASAARASDAASAFIENLESCTATEWETRPIAGTGAVLAVSSDAVAWIWRKAADVRVLQIPTTDGPPPLDVQVAVAEWMVAYHAWQEEQRD